MSRIPLPSAPNRQRSSSRRNRALWALLIGGVGAAVAGRGRLMALLGRGSEDEVYAGANVGYNEGPAVAAAQTEVDDIEHEEVPAAGDPAGEAAPGDGDFAEAVEAEPTDAAPAPEPVDDLPPVAGDEIDPTLSATEVADPAAVVDPGEAAVEPASDPAATPDPAPLETDGTDADPLAIDEAEKAAAEAGAIGSEPEDADRP